MVQKKGSHSALASAYWADRCSHRSTLAPAPDPPPLIHTARLGIWQRMRTACAETLQRTLPEHAVRQERLARGRDLRLRFAWLSGVRFRS